MSDGFWAQRLGVQQAPAAPAPAPSSRPWWQPGHGVVVQQQPVVQPAAPQPPVQTPVPTQQVQPNEMGEVPIEVLLTQEEYTTTKAQSAKDTERCPDCDSPNYMRSSQSPNSLKQCFNCGFNPRFLHTTHGASGTGQKDLPIRVARNQVLSENNFNPQHVIGRVA